MSNASTQSHRRRNRTIGTFGLVALTGLAFAIASGCSNSEAAPAPGKDAPAAQVGASSKEADSYKTAIASSGACTAGKECKVEVSLESKGAFHINDKYPLKFKASDPAPDGVTYTKATVKREDGKFEERKGSLPVAFTAARAGKVKIGGTFSFSVCSDANCVMEKVELAVDVDVK